VTVKPIVGLFYVAC